MEPEENSAVVPQRDSCRLKEWRITLPYDECRASCWGYFEGTAAELMGLSPLWMMGIGRDAMLDAGYSSAANGRCMA